MTIGSLCTIKLGDRYTTDGKDVWVVETIRPFPSVTLRRVESPDGDEAGAIDACLGDNGLARFQRLDL